MQLLLRKSRTQLLLVSWNFVAIEHSNIVLIIFIIIFSGNRSDFQFLIFYFFILLGVSVDAIIQRCSPEGLSRHYQTASFATVTEFLIQIARMRGKLGQVTCFVFFWAISFDAITEFCSQLFHSSFVFCISGRKG
jgi:hypothetical protein